MSSTDQRLARLRVIYGARGHRAPAPQYDHAALTLEEQFNLDQLLARDGCALPGEAVAGPLDPTERATLAGLLRRCDGSTTA